MLINNNLQIFKDKCTSLIAKPKMTFRKFISVEPASPSQVPTPKAPQNGESMRQPDISSEHGVEMSSFKLSALPADVQAMIVKKLDVPTTQNLRLASRVYGQSVAILDKQKVVLTANKVSALLDNSIFSKLHPTFFENKLRKVKLNPEITDEELTQLIDKGYLNNLRSLDMSHCTQLTGKCLEKVFTCTSLHQLALPPCLNYKDQDFKGLASLKKLTQLYIRPKRLNTQVNESLFEGIAALPNLEELTCTNSQLKASDFEKLSTIIKYDLDGNPVYEPRPECKITTLNIFNAVQKGQDLLGSISRSMPNLNYLNIANGYKIIRSSNYDITALKLNKLTHLVIDDRNITGASLLALHRNPELAENLPALQSINIIGIPKAAKLACLASFSRVSELTIGASGKFLGKNILVDEHLVSLARFKNLTNFTLTGNVEISLHPKNYPQTSTVSFKKLVDCLSGMEHLEQLSLSFDKYGSHSKGLESLSELKKIKSLSLSIYDPDIDFPMSHHDILKGLSSGKKNELSQIEAIRIPFAPRFSGISRVTKLSKFTNLKNITFTSDKFTKSDDYRFAKLQKNLPGFIQLHKDVVENKRTVELLRE